MFSSKKAMSPLIATILLIAFAVSIGAVIMSYGNVVNTEDAAQSDSYCSRVKLEVYNIDGVPQLCYRQGEDKDYLSFILINKGAVGIDSLQILASQKGSANTLQMMDIPASSISAGFPLQKEMAIETRFSDLVQIQFIAQSIVGSDTIRCFLEPMPISTIRRC